MKKRQILIPAFLAIAMSASLIAGATYSLFTSESTHDITVSAGKVVLKSTIDSTLTLKSMGTKQDNGTFANGGTAKIEENVLNLENITPGDEVSFKINLNNESNVTIKYRITLRCKSGPELFAGLEITTDIAQDWDYLNLDDDKSFSKTVTVKLPKEAGNEYQGLNSEIVINVEAVQANAEDYNPTNPELDKSEDALTVVKMNKILAAAKPATMADAVSSLKATYDLETIRPLSKDQTFAYNASTKKMLTILNSDLLTRPADANTWLVIDNEADLDKYTANYSTYLTSTFTEDDGNKTISPKLNCDTSALKESYTINYIGGESAKTVDLYTGKGTINVNAPLDTVNHYGTAHAVNVESVASHSYHEFGEILGHISVKAGRVVAEPAAVVPSVVVTAEDITGEAEKNVTVENKTETKVTVVATNDNVKNKIEQAVTGTVEIKQEVVDETVINKFAGGLGTKENPYLLSNAQHLLNIGDIYDDSKVAITFHSFKMVDDIDFYDIHNTRFQYKPAIASYFNGEIDGDNHNLTLGYTSKESSGLQTIKFLFSFSKEYARFANLNIYQKEYGCGLLYGPSEGGNNAVVEETICENINIYNASGLLRTEITNNNDGFFINNVENVTMKNVHNYANFNVPTDYIGVFVGNYISNKNKTALAIFEECWNHGTIVCPKVGVLTGNSNSYPSTKINLLETKDQIVENKLNIYISHCGNKGNVIGTEYAGILATYGGAGSASETESMTALNELIASKGIFEKGNIITNKVNVNLVIDEKGVSYNETIENQTSYIIRAYHSINLGENGSSYVTFATSENSSLLPIMKCIDRDTCLKKYAINYDEIVSDIYTEENYKEHYKVTEINGTVYAVLDNKVLNSIFPDGPITLADLEVIYELNVYNNGNLIATKVTSSSKLSK